MLIGERAKRAPRALLAGLPKALAWGCGAALISLFTRVSLLNGLSPFAPAAFAAALLVGRSPYPLLIGCALGGFWARDGLFAICPLAGCLLIWGFNEALKRTGLAEKSVFRSPDAKCALLAGLGALLPPALFSGGVVLNLLSACLNCAVALAAAPVLIGGLSLAPGRTALMPDERLSLSFIALLALFGLTQTPFHLAAPALAALFALILSKQGAPQGAAAGLIAGMALSLSGGGAALPQMFGLLGFAAGLAAPYGRIWAALAFAAGDALFLAYGAGSVSEAICALAAGGLFCLLPENALDRLSGWLAPGKSGCQADKLAARIRGGAEKRLRALANVFSDMAAGYAEPVGLPDEQALIAQMRRLLCAGCPGYKDCWNGADGRAGRLLCALLGDALRGKPLSADSELPPDAGRICRRASSMPRRLSGLLKEFYDKRQGAIKRREAGAQIARQFRQAGDILTGMGDRFSQPFSVDGEISALAAAALEREGLNVSEALALDADGLEVITALRQGEWDIERAARAAKRLSTELGVPMRPVLAPGKAPGEELRLVQSPALSCTVGYAACARSNRSPSGDSHLAAGLTGGRVLLALSDGMGSGERAARESARTIRLLRRFLLAEIDKGLMLETVNQLLLLRGGDDMYATADLCVVDLQKGAAEFLKLGACASYVLRKGICRRVEGGRLPLGILDRVSPASSTVAVKPGDMIVMTTDGVADSASEEQSAWLESQLRALSGETPGNLSEKLIEAAQARQGARDDMTVLAARIGRAK